MRRGASALEAGLVETTAGLRFPARRATPDGVVSEYADELYDGALGAVVALEAAREVHPRARWGESASRVFSDAAAALRLVQVRHGLHGGDGGFVATALHLAHRRQDRATLLHAIAVGEALRAAPFAWADLLAGAAGSGLAFLHLHRATGDASWLRAARAAIEWLGDHALPQPQGVAWHWDGDPDQPPDDVQTGFAHGSAGIITFLATATAAGVRVRGARTLLRAASRWLDSAAIWDSDRAMWPVSTHSPRQRHHWCHGTTGIARAYLARARAAEPRALGHAVAAGTHAWVATWSALRGTGTHETLCHCHGIAGLAELCADLDGMVPGGLWRRRALKLAHHLHQVSGEGSRASMLGAREFGYSSGLAGIVHLLARLSGATLPALDRVDETPVLRALLRASPHRRLDATPATAMSSRDAPLVAPVVGVPMEGFPRRLLEVAPYRDAERTALTARILASDAGAPMRIVNRHLEQGFAGLRRRVGAMLGPQALTLATHQSLLADLFGLLVLTPATAHDGPHRVAVARFVARAHLRALDRMLVRLERDLRGCLRDRVRGPLLRATPMRGEPHRGQQRVFRLDFAEGPALAYKPRDVRVDWHVMGANRHGECESGAARINHALARRGLASRVPMHDIIPGGDHHGYAEWITAPTDALEGPSTRRPAAPHRARRLEPYSGLQLRDHAAATHFWRSAGATALHLSAFGVADMHRENLLVGTSRSGERAVLHPIDLENAFCVLKSLADTGLVPRAGDPVVPRAARDHSHDGFDVRLPAFCDVESRDWAFIEVGDRLQLLAGHGILGSPTVLNGVRNPDGSSGHAPYLGAMIRGLVDAWQAVRGIRASLGKQITQAAAGVTARVLVRHTATYMPRWSARMTGGAQGLDQMGNGAYPAAPLAPEERAQLDLLDVPTFFRRVGRPGIWWNPRGEGRPTLASVVPPMAPATSPAACIAAATTVRQLARAIIDLTACVLAAGPVDLRDDAHGVRVARARESARLDVVVVMPHGPAQIALLPDGEVVHWGLPAR